MFKAILIANRGEIACRIIATCRRLGVAPVAVYSDADAGARHVRLADEAVAIGPAAVTESYLAVEKILDAARRTGAEAVHPGYGFLAENPQFARQVAEAGLVLIGPSVETIEAMGSKARAKAIMEAAGVPLVPGYHGDAQDDRTLAAEAEKVGFPLMLKAASGGGGKGMRIVRSAEEFSEALGAARREAASAFGDETMILERFLERPRHIEAQIFGDLRGRVIHLFERDCSSQRRHQKVIEEAPAPALDDKLRAQLLDAAVRAGEAVDYHGAGTVEFLVDGEAFYFLEMNTRLQVEHPVTEMITGEDLVEWQLRIAAGEPLPRGQDELRCRGHAMEARIYAEDPERNFLPGSGRIEQLAWPAGAGVRIDSGVESGDRVSVHYDPMIAKLVVHAPDRRQCLARLQSALADCFVGGLVTNLGFLQQLTASDEFRAGTLDTGLLDRDLERLLAADSSPPEPVLAAAACYWMAAQEKLAAASSPEPQSPWALLDGWRPGTAEARSLDLESPAGRRAVSGRGTTGAGYRLRLDAGDGTDHSGSRPESSAGLILDDRGRGTIALNGARERVTLHAHRGRLEIVHRRRRWALARHTRFEAVAEAGAGSGRIVAPMPGKVIQLRVRAGDSVTEGQTVAVMEAMKMELSIKSPIGGTVEQVSVGEGDLAEADELLIEIAGS